MIPVNKKLDLWCHKWSKKKLIRNKILTVRRKLLVFQITEKYTKTFSFIGFLIFNASLTCCVKESVHDTFGVITECLPDINQECITFKMRGGQVVDERNLCLTRGARWHMSSCSKPSSQTFKKTAMALYDVHRALYLNLETNRLHLSDKVYHTEFRTKHFGLQYVGLKSKY